MSKQRFRPLGDGVVVKPTPPQEVTQSGLIIPKNAQEKTQVGVIHEIGSGSVEVKVGDTVLFGKHAGMEVEVNGEGYLLMKNTDIYGVFESQN
jgi:chaperonin GroES